MISLLRQKLSEVLSTSIYLEALKYIGTDASPSDRVDDVVGCAESVTEILSKVIRFPVVTGTWTLWDKLRRDQRFRETTIPMPGDIIISPTGTGNGRIRGHVGIFGKNLVIMANDSDTGKWMAFYTLDSWKDRYEKKGGIKTWIFTQVHG